MKRDFSIGSQYTSFVDGCQKKFASGSNPLVTGLPMGTITCNSALLPAPAVLTHRHGKQALAQRAGLMNQG